MDLFHFTKLMHNQLEQFEKYWLEQHSKNPEQFPLSMPNDNSGLWLEMFEQFNENDLL